MQVMPRRSTREWSIGWEIREIRLSASRCRESWPRTEVPLVATPGALRHDGMGERHSRGKAGCPYRQGRGDWRSGTTHGLLGLDSAADFGNLVPVDGCCPTRIGRIVQSGAAPQ